MRKRKFESTPLQRRVNKLSVPLKTMPVVRLGTIAFAIILALVVLAAALRGAATRVSRC
jgi:hypothetical protein